MNSVVAVERPACLPSSLSISLHFFSFLIFQDLARYEMDFFFMIWQESLWFLSMM